MSAMSNLRLCFPLLLMVLVGCGDGRVRLPTAPVAGTVTYQGKPLGVGRVLFVHPSGQPAGADIAADGTFKLVAFQGRNQVAIQCFVKPGTTSDTNIGLGPGESLIPIRYSEVKTSGLTFDVKPEEANQAQFTLKD
jgi:hypothetical protein